MNDTLLLVGHGSRRPGSNDQVETFVQLWRQRHPDWSIEVCFIELAEVLLEAGLDRAAAHGRRVIVLPLILNTAGHVKRDIPAAVAAARARHPTIEFACAPHLGLGCDIFAIVMRRLDGLMREMAMPDPRTTGVILLGRGSSDPSTNGDMARLARWVYEASEHDLADIAFTDIAHPRLESVVQRQVRLGMSQILVQPIYLFTGVLIERIGEQMTRLKQAYPQVSFALGSYFGCDESLFALLDERATAAADDALLDRDGRAFRQTAAERVHSHGHDPEHGPAHDTHRPATSPAPIHGGGGGHLHHHP
ncbi:MAG: sirohydrochlorin chelatase [Candidatus Competibacter sp.]|nr:sirohydrochlorin chelatase [Candidatus Competibacter sp.]MDG4585044.1 sirohydrochlorin chelatase [Candidatus Competibacter sp.]